MSVAQATVDRAASPSTAPAAARSTPRRSAFEAETDEARAPDEGRPTGPGVRFDFAGIPVQRMCAACELEVGPAEDEYEDEADRVASEVASGRAARVQRRVAPGAQRDAAGGGGSVAAPAIVGEVLRGAGAPLDAGTRAFMEARIGHDFGDVRVHTDARADASARAVDALAYTVGHDIAFRTGLYDPASGDGRRLLAHELAHVAQQGGARVLRRQVGRGGGPVSAVRVSCADSRIVFDAASGSYAYRMNACNLPVGEYTVGVTVQSPTRVYFDFGRAIASTERFQFGYDIDPGQINPATLFARQREVHFSVVDHLPLAAPSQAVASPTSLAERLAAFKRMIKEAGKQRQRENIRALGEWRTFLTERLTPSQVRGQVGAEEVRSLIDTATTRGSQETAVAEQWLQTRGPNQRWVMQQQIEGRYRACTGCHATVQATDMDRRLAERGFPQRTPLEFLRGVDVNAPRPSMAQEAPSTGRPVDPGMYPSVAQAQARIAEIQPYLRILGPEGFHVLPAEVIGSNASAATLVNEISRRIVQRQNDYRTFISRIDAPDFDYLHLRPIVRDLLPLADADVQEAVRQEIESAETWATVESIVVGAATIALLLLTIFPPTSVIGIAGTLALGAAVSAHQIYRGYESVELGYTYSLARGAHNVLDPDQQMAGEGMMVMGVVNMVLGAIGLGGAAVGTVRLIRAAPPPGGGLGALQVSEAEAGGQLIRVNWGARDPQVTVISPGGRVVRQGPASSFGARTTSGARPAPRAQGGGMVYPTEGGAARVAQPVAPVAEPVAEVIPLPVAPRPAPAPAPAPPAPRVPPNVRGPIGTMATTSAADTVAMAGRAGPQPVMPRGLSRTERELWRQCSEQHNRYKATQEELADLSTPAHRDLRTKMYNGTATEAEERLFCATLHRQINLVERLQRERRRYMELDCDRFDWFAQGTTAAERLAAHQEAEAQTRAQRGNLYELLHRFCGRQE